MTSRAKYLPGRSGCSGAVPLPPPRPRPHWGQSVIWPGARRPRAQTSRRGGERRKPDVYGREPARDAALFREEACAPPGPARPTEVGTGPQTGQGPGTGPGFSAAVGALSVSPVEPEVLFFCVTLDSVRLLLSVRATGLRVPRVSRAQQQQDGGKTPKWCPCPPASPPLPLPSIRRWRRQAERPEQEVEGDPAVPAHQPVQRAAARPG